MAGPRVRLIALTALGAMLLAAHGSAQPAVETLRQLRALEVAEEVVVNGVLDESAWSRAEVAGNFIQQQPDEGSPATDTSEIRVLYDGDALYIGGTFFDANPRLAISNELKRDFSARDGDLITVVLDTFHDTKTSFNFMINPAGALRDSQSYDDGRQNNANWDGVWSVKTRAFEDRWCMEMRIPFRTLRFSSGDDQTWGFNVFRLVRRKNEISLWSPIPRQFNQFKTSFAGALSGMRGVRSGRNVHVKPYVIGSGTRGLAPEFGWGADVKYGLGTASTLDLTYRTDFAQVEQDEQQLNLTRFSLFLPEKREFFLENQGVFRMGDIDEAMGVRSPIIPFFSRRIGLSGTGERVPIVGGGRLSSHLDSWRVGALNLQTDPDGDGAGDNFSALRVARDTRRHGSYSMFYLGREGRGADGVNRVFGGDMHLAPTPTIDLDLFVLRSHATVEGQGTAGRASLNVREKAYTGHLSFTHLGDQFRNDLGFIPRPNVNLLSWEFQRHFRPAVRRLPILTYTAGADGDVYWTAATSALESRAVKAIGMLEFADGSIFNTSVSSAREILVSPFTVAGLTVVAGNYDFTQVALSYASDRSRPLSGTAGLTVGEYWSGHLKTVDVGLRARASKHLAVSVTASRSPIELASGDVTLSLLRLRADYSFSTNMFVNAFAQYSSETRTWASNVRFRYTYRPLSDLFIVYSSLDRTGTVPTRSLAVKTTVLFNF